MQSERLEPEKQDDKALTVDQDRAEAPSQDTTEAGGVSADHAENPDAEPVATSPADDEPAPSIFQKPQAGHHSSGEPSVPPSLLYRGETAPLPPSSESYPERSKSPQQSTNDAPEQSSREREVAVETGSRLANRTTQRDSQPVTHQAEHQSESRPGKNRVTPDTEQGTEKPKGLLDLAPDEQVVREIDSGEDGRFILTNMRLIYQGKSSEGTLFATADVSDITSIKFGRRPRDVRSAWWGTVGLIAAIAVWQVTATEAVGSITGAVVAGISALLLADYWFRPPGLVIRFGTPGGAVEGAVSGKHVRDAEQLAVEVQQLRRAGGFTGNGFRGKNTGPSRPPGGSPGLD